MLLCSHYEVDIRPVVAVVNQKKPKALMKAVWEQLSLEHTGDWADAFAACAFDGSRNAFTPVAFPGPQGEYSFKPQQMRNSDYYGVTFAVQNR